MTERIDKRTRDAQSEPGAGRVSGERLSSYGDVARAGCTVGGERTVQAVQMNVVCEVGTQH